MIKTERVSGDSVHKIVAEQGLHSIRERSANLNALRDIQSVILLGSTCVGKSTLERAVRTASLEDPLLKEKVSVPQRVATRPIRADDGDDIYFCSPDEFIDMISSNRLGLYGIKIMEGGREEPYGYLKSEEGTLPVFFANNQTLRNRASVYPQGILESSLIVLIYAQDHIREERLKARSPQLFEERPDEVAFRLSRDERAVGLASDAHLIVRNYGKSASRSAGDLTGLIKGIVEVFNGRRC